jgi:hypothetical protein
MTNGDVENTDMKQDLRYYTRIAWASQVMEYSSLALKYNFGFKKVNVKVRNKELKGRRSNERMFNVRMIHLTNGRNQCQIELIDQQIE